MIDGDEKLLAVREFKAGDRVRVTGHPRSGDVGEVECEGASALWPYRVRFGDGAAYWYAGHELEPAQAGVAQAAVAADGPVNHPPHYGGADDPYEAVKVIEAWGLGFHAGTALKYVARHLRKGRPAEDLRKAIWYLDRLASRYERDASLAKLEGDT